MMAGSTCISFLPVSSTSARLIRPFIAIHGQWLQLVQFAPCPAVGASRKTLSGHSVRILCRMPLSVATMNSFASEFCAALMSCVVEPTTSASLTTARGDSGCTSTMASGMLRLQLDEFFRLVFVMHDARALPQQHVRAGLFLDVAAEMAVRRPQYLLAALHADA